MRSLFFSLNLIFLSVAAQAANLYQMDKASLGFSTWIRTEVPSRIVESEDPSILGESLSFYQSLSYTGSKEISFSGSYGNEMELRTQIQLSVCAVAQDVDLHPIREAGAKGARLFKLKLKPSFVIAAGILTVGDKTSPFSLTITCRKL